MRGRPPPQVIPWPPQGGYDFTSPDHLNKQHQPHHSQAHHNVIPSPRSRHNVVPSPHSHHDFVPSPHSYHCLQGLDSGMPDVSMRRDQWSSYDQSTVGMAGSKAPTFTPAAPPTYTSHAPHIDYGHTHHPSDRLNIRLSAPPQYLDPILNASSIPSLTPPKSTHQPESNTERLPDNKGNLERMRHERELVFEKAATELDQARSNVAPTVPSNKAWESAWEVMRQSMANM